MKFVATKSCAVLTTFVSFIDHSKGFGGKYGVQSDRQDAVSLISEKFHLQKCSLRNMPYCIPKAYSPPF